MGMTHSQQVQIVPAAGGGEAREAGAVVQHSQDAFPRRLQRVSEPRGRAPRVGHLPAHAASHDGMLPALTAVEQS